MHEGGSGRGVSEFCSRKVMIANSFSSRNSRETEIIRRESWARQESIMHAKFLPPSHLPFDTYTYVVTYTSRCNIYFASRNPICILALLLRARVRLFFAVPSVRNARSLASKRERTCARSCLDETSQQTLSGFPAFLSRHRLQTCLLSERRNRALPTRGQTPRGGSEADWLRKFT